MIEGRDFAAASILGARARQEDEWGTHHFPPALEEGALLLAAVTDGMGGMPGGNQASRIVIRTFFDSYPLIARPVRGRLLHALAHANRELGIAIEVQSDLDGMGCTLVAALFFGDRCEWLSVGDSLILLCRRGQIERINPCHVFANELAARVKRGEITEEEAQDHPEKAMLTSAVQGGPVEEVAQGELFLEPGDVVLLASDGIATLSDEEIAQVCADSFQEGAHAMANALVGRIEAMDRDGQDNATVVVVRQASAEADTERIMDSKAAPDLGDVARSD